MPQDRPKWAADLAAAQDRASWLPAIINADENAVVGFLRRHGLPDPGLPVPRAATIEAALIAGTVTDADLESWRERVFADFAAVDGIEDFRQKGPLVQKFRAEIGVPFGPTAAVLDEVRRRIWRGDLMRQRWVEFLDRHRDQTDRDIFLFRLPAAHQGDLAKWGEKDVLDAEMASRGFTHIVGATHYEWKPVACELVGVNLLPEHQLELQWVGLRNSMRRCLTFARVNLQTGSIDLQIQRVTRGGMQALVTERELFVGELTRLLGVRPESVRLEPAMRALLNTHGVDTEMWRVRVGQTGELTGKRHPMLRIGNDRYYALELAGQWHEGNAASLPIRMDARTDAIGVHCQCPVAAVSDLLVFARRHADRVRVPPSTPAPPISTGGGTGIGDVPIEDPRIDELRALIEKLVAYLTVVAPDVDVSTLASPEITGDLLVTDDEVESALEIVGLEGTGAKLYVICPDTNEPVRQGGRVVELERLPAKITCENHAARRCTRRKETRGSRSVNGAGSG